MTTMTPTEQMLLEMANRARMDPAAEAARLGISLNQYIDPSSSGYPITTAAKQVLAGSNILQGVAERHVDVVWNNPNFPNFDPHNGAGDGSVVDRIAAAGYQQNSLPWYRPENFVYWQTSAPLDANKLQELVENSHNSLFIDDPANSSGEGGGHRLALMDPNMKEFEAGLKTGVLQGWNTVMSFENFGVSGTQSFLTGVVYDDSVRADRFYTIGEGLKGVTATVTNASGATVGSDATGSGGGWSVGEPGGTYTVTFSGGGLAQAVAATVTAGNLNAKVDLVNGVRIESDVGTTLGAGAYDLHLLGYGNASGTGNGLANEIVGNRGNNLLNGRGGADLLQGLGGNDTYAVDNAGDQIVEGTNQGNDTVVATVSYSLAAHQQVETLQLSSATGNTALNLSGNEFANTLVGNGGANTLNGRGGIDILKGLGGNDVYAVDNAGDQVIEGTNQGNDTVVASVSYALAENQQVETLQFASSTGSAALNLSGNAFANTLIGNAGANTLNGRGGLDILKGLGGNDVYAVDNAGDQVIEGSNQGSDTVVATVGYTLAAGQSIERLQLASSTGSQALNLTGNEIANTLTGNAGANVLNGGLSSDILTGNAGADSFAFKTALGSGNVDHITDFSHAADTIQLSKTIFAALGTGPLPEAAFRDLAMSGGWVDSDDRILYDRTTGVLSYDADGGGGSAAVPFAVLDNKPADLNHTDFLIIA